MVASSASSAATPRQEARRAKPGAPSRRPEEPPLHPAEPRYVGGQAVVEGVMMRGASTWAIAVRKPDGEIAVDVREVPGWSEKYRNVPILRGVTGLGESLGLGYRALTWSANQQMPEEEQVSERAMGWAIVPVAVFFSAVFIVIPAFAGKGLSHLFHGSFPIVEGVVRLALFVGYLLLVGRLKDIRRVFQYHGAEHKAIAAYENDVELTPETAQQFSTAHVRCGTNFLLIVMVVAVFVYSVIPRPNLWFVIGSRIVLMPVIAGLSYEVIRLAAKNMQRRWVRVLMRPGPLACSGSRRASPTSTSSRSRSRRCARCSPPSSTSRSTPAPADACLRSRPPSDHSGACPELLHLPAMIDMQLTWTEPELLAEHDIAEPLVAGRRALPRRLRRRRRLRLAAHRSNRVPAIEAWQQSHREQFGTEILDAPLELWPEVFPNVAQSKYLLREGVREPTISALTRIGTVEGFGSMIRAVQVDRLQSHFDESIAGTAIAHLQRGLFEAHARDEAGWEDEGGHKQMWFAARDIAFEHPVTDDMTQTMLERMGIVAPDGKPPTPEEAQAAARRCVASPDLDLSLEMMLRRMVGLLFIEVSAFHTFAWAEEVLSDRDLVAGDGAPPTLVSYVRADETPARRVPAHRADRDARPHVRRRVGSADPRHRGDRHVVGRRARAVARRQPPELRAPGDGRGRARARSESAAGPKCSKASTRWGPVQSA